MNNKAFADEKMITKSDQKKIENEAFRLNNLLPDKLDNMIQVFKEDPQLIKDIENLVDEENIYTIKELQNLYIKYIDFKVYSERKKGNYVEFLRFITKKGNENPIIQARARRILGAIASWFDHDYDEDIRCAKEALEILDSLPENPYIFDEKFLLTNRLTQAYLLKGKITTAKRYSDQAEEIIKNQSTFLSEKEVFYRARAKLLHDQGNFEESLNYAYLAREYSKDENLVQIDILITAILMKMGDYTKAYNIINKVFEDKIDKLNYNQSKGGVLLMLAATQMHLGKLDIAYSNLAEGYQIFKNKYSKPTLFNASSEVIYGDYYFIINDYNKAFEKYLIAEGILYDLYDKDEAMDTLSEVYFKIIKTSAKLKDLTTINQYFLKQKEIFGTTHRRSKMIIEEFKDFLI